MGMVMSHTYSNESSCVFTVFQKNPFFLFHLHFVRLLPVATFPSSQTAIHVAPSQLIEATPAGCANTGHNVVSAAARIPIGCPHPPVRRLAASRASEYLG